MDPMDKDLSRPDSEHTGRMNFWDLVDHICDRHGISPLNNLQPKSEKENRK